MHEDQPKRRQKIAFESQPAERVGIDQHFTVGAGATKNFYEPVAITTSKASHIHKKRQEGPSPGIIASETLYLPKNTTKAINPSDCFKTAELTQF